MPKDISSPFTPGLPVQVDFFVGREAQIGLLRKKVRRATSGRLEVGFLIGERGIGKSSLASFVRALSERDEHVLGLHTLLGGVNTLEEMVRSIFERLLKEGVGTPWQEKVRGFFGNFIREVGLFGISVEFEAPERDLRRLAHDFTPVLRNLIDRLKDDKKGILLILDDINGLARSANFANWLKSLVDEIATSQKPIPFCLLLVGIEERRQSLIALQPSLARVFDLVEIPAWSDHESQAFLRNAFSRVRMEIDEPALDTLVGFAGGLPVLAHEIGDAAFNVDTDGRIDDDDAIGAVIGAADIIGRKHLQPQVFQAIRSQRYRRILRKLAETPVEAQFQRGSVLKRLTKEEIKVFDNFIRRMEKLGVVAKDTEGGPGAYRFTNYLHRLYFWLEAKRAKEAREP